MVNKYVKFNFLVEHTSLIFSLSFIIAVSIRLPFNFFINRLGLVWVSPFIAAVSGVMFLILLSCSQD